MAMATDYDATFVHDPQADLPYERDLSSWLGAATLSAVVWVIEVPTLLEKHDETTLGGNTIARVWLRGLGLTGNTKVTCRFTASDGRKDDRTWMIAVRER